jgi:hypothetical protein
MTEPVFSSSTRDIPSVSAVPRHIAIIMDGNGRWARKRFMPRVAGHTRGVEAVRAVIRGCMERGVVPDAVRLQLRELAPAAGRGVLPDAALPEVAAEGSGSAP